jgi:large subunit ribosomal protein L4
MPKATTDTKPEKKEAKAKVGLEVSLLDIKGTEVDKLYLPEKVFNVKGSDGLLTQYVRVYLANQRQGTKSVKTRSEIVGSTHKIYKQKGTGRARHSTRKASLFVGGGVTHGPQPTDYSLQLNKKQRQNALLYALSKRLKEKNIYFVKGLLDLSGKTKEMAVVMDGLAKNSSKLVLYPKQESKNLVLGARNISGVQTREISILNAYEVLKFKKIIFTKEALDLFLERHNDANK